MSARRGMAIGLLVAAVFAPSWTTAVAQEPADPVARVGEVAISLADFEHWFAQAVHAHFRGPVGLEPPEYAGCVSAKRRLRTRKGWRELSERELRVRCSRDRRMLRAHATQFLIQARWIEREAARQRLTIGERRVDRMFENQKRQAFSNELGYRRFLRDSGADEASIKYRIWIDALQAAITRRVVRRARPVTEQDVTRHLAAHPGRYAGMGPRAARRKARARLVAARQQRQLWRFIDRFRRRHRAVTWCATDHAVPECGKVALPGDRQ